MYVSLRTICTGQLWYGELPYYDRTTLRYGNVLLIPTVVLGMDFYSNESRSKPGEGVKTLSHNQLSGARSKPDVNNHKTN